MRSLLLMTSLLAFAPSLAAQRPAPDAPIAVHVSYLLEQATSGFRGVRGENTYGPMAMTEFGSSYPIRFRGTDAPSEMHLNLNWNVMHLTVLPVSGTRAAADSAWRQVADEIARVIPVGWRETRTDGDVRHAIWQECEQGRGREVSLATMLPFEQPGLYLIVYRYDLPCPARAGG